MPITVQVLPIIVGGKPQGLAPKRRIDAELLAGLKPGAYKAKISKLRSIKADRLYHCAIEVAADNWPEGEEPEPKGDKELLRAWLQCKAGPNWRKSADFPWDTRHSAIFLIEHLVGEGRYAFTERIDTDQGPKFRVHVPLSINHDNMDDEEFQPLRAAVLEMLELKFNCSALELVAHGEAA